MTEQVAPAEVPFLNIAAPDFSMSSEAVRDARERSWYAQTNYGIGVLRHAEVTELLKNPALTQGSAKWPDHHGVHSGVFYDWWAENLLVLEGEDHDRLRRLLNPAFSPSAARRLDPEFIAITDDLIEGMKAKAAAGEPVDFVADFSEPFATRALCAMLSLPHDNWRFIATRASTAAYALGIDINEKIDSIDEAVAELYAFIEALIEERQANPGDDLVSAMLGIATADDGTLSGDELRNALVLMLVGGTDTTRNQLGLAIQTFMRYPEQWELLAARPEELGRAAVEEVIRVNPTTRWVTREASEDILYKDVLIERGTTVHLFTQTSGTDPEAYPDPDINIESPSKTPHHTFGGGPHKCLGQYVARADIGVALPRLAQAFSNLACPGGDEWLPDSGNHGPAKLPLTFTVR